MLTGDTDFNKQELIGINHTSLDFSPFACVQKLMDNLPVLGALHSYTDKLMDETVTILIRRVRLNLTFQLISSYQIDYAIGQTKMYLSDSTENEF